MIRDAIIRHFHLFGALGGGAQGFQRANGRVQVGSLRARFECIGSVDVDAAACRDFERRVGAPATVMDLFDRDQYRAWHGEDPPLGWREVSPADIRCAAGGQRPHIVFTSPPCKGFSGLLNEPKSRTAKYQALNRLTLRGLWLALEAWADDPPEFFLLENVPRIATRGRHLLDQMSALLRRYGYAVAETTHDCGELGGLAQSRKRFLLVARHEAKVPPFLYEPRTRPLRAVGTVLSRCPLPGDLSAGPMHRVPALQFKTWLRLAFVEAGKDWRSLARLRVVDGVLADYGLVPDGQYHNGMLGVRRWDQAAGTITGQSLPCNGAHAVADPRRGAGAAAFGQYGVREWTETAATVTSQSAPGQGPVSIADPRLPPGPRGPHFSNCYRVVRFDDVGRTVTGGGSPSAGGVSVADPRASGAFEGAGKYRVTAYGEPTGTIIAGSTTGQGAFAVADPRPAINRCTGAYVTAGHYGVVPFDAPCGAITSAAGHDNGRFSVADPRLPAPNDRVVAVIRAEDGTWHRPFTTFEMGALQTLFDPEERAELDGLSDQAWRERIGNAVPPEAAEAIAGVMARTLLLAWTGHTFVLDTQPIWVRPIAEAIALPDVQGAFA